MGSILLTILAPLLVGGFPRWRHSRNWGDEPIGVIGVIILTVLALMLLGGIPRGF